MTGKANQGYTPDEEEKNGLSNRKKSEKSTIFSLNETDVFVTNGKSKIAQDESSQGKGSDEKTTEKNLPSVGPIDLFRYASCCDVVLMVIGVIIAVVSGVSLPAVLVVFGKVIDQFIIFEMSRSQTNATTELNYTTLTTEEFLSNTAELCMWNALLGIFVFVNNYIFVTCFSIPAANQAFRIRCRLMQAVLRQEMAWYDTHQTGDFATRITGDLTHIQDGMGDKVSMCISFLSTTFFCVGCGIYNGWKLALVVLCWSPLLTGALAIVSKMQATVASQEMDAYATAGAVAEEVLGSIRTVVAFGGQQKEIQRYEDCLVPASSKGIKRGLLTGVGAGITWFSIFAGYALAFWYGMKLVLDEIDSPDPEYTGGRLIMVFMNVMIASMFVGQSAPYFEAFNLARGAAAKVFSIIDRESKIDSSSEAGIRPKAITGHIKLKDVHFNYPARPEIPILRGLTMEVKPGETVALVGASGCGKSTIVQLLLRFYDTDSGKVELDGSDIKQLNIGWLRDHIGLVGQEPVLFSTTIEENIRMGRNDATMKDVIQAAKTANAHNFIEALPKKYQTTVGEKGTQLSGGQKQRIAIARALVRNPRILLLDEATSALDTESESVVQAALDEARRGRTTVIVAHRLSTIRTADKIIVLEEGVVKETGSHEELMEAGGIYYNLVVTQTTSNEEELDEEEDVGTPYMERQTSVVSVGSEDGRPNLDRQISTLSIFGPNMDRQISIFSRQLSATPSDMDKEEEEEKVDDTSSFSQTRLLKMSAVDWPYILVGGMSSVLAGLHFPAFGIIFGDLLGVLKEPIDVMQEWTNYYCLILLGMAITAGISNFSQVFLFSVASQRLTFRLRKMVFANIISQDISFFDSSKNGVGSLCSRLNSDASSVQGATGSRISIALQSLSTLAICIFIALYYNWKIGLLNLAFLPLMLLGAAVEARVVRGHMQSEKKGIELASKVAIEAIECIRTVASLHREETFYKKYHDALLPPHKKSKMKSHVRGLAHAFGQAIGYFAYPAVLYTGSRLISQGEVTYVDLMKVLRAVMVGSAVMGQVISFTPDYEKARTAAIRIFRLLELRPSIDAFSVQGKTKNSIKGTVEFSEVHFSYPKRPQIKVLRGLDAVVQPGQTVALVGSSGCGKSTCVQLLERFYDPTDGKVMVDSDDIMQLNVSNHRSHMALVSQEPVLFGGTIAENIAYGDNSRQPDMNEIIEVARQANIHGFVSALPRGYDTPVGDRGTQLSGGQKQRIAIARALIRNPRILLLDEATSALDAESEKVVQEALDAARSGRTCVVIAHRLTTVQNADLILVLQRGKIVEKGTHQELINKKGFYYKLHNTQA